MFWAVGLPDKAVTEGFQRMEAAIRNVGFRVMRLKMVVNLAPANLRKEGSAYDLPIAIGMLAAMKQMNADIVKDFIMMGELSLDGTLQPIKGALPIAIQARKEKFRGLIVPKENAKEAAKLAEIQAKQAAERAKIEAEQRRIESEKRKAAEENARIEAETRRKLAEKAEREAEEARIAELTKKRLKGLTQGIESWEIIDLNKVPIHLLRIELNLPEVKKYLKENETVPGLEIQFKNKLVLNGK